VSNNATYTVQASEDDRGAYYDWRGGGAGWYAINKATLAWLGRCQTYYYDLEFWSYLRFPINIPPNARVVNSYFILSGQTGYWPRVRTLNSANCPDFDRPLGDVPPPGITLQQFLALPGYAPGNYVGFEFYYSRFCYSGKCDSFDSGNPPQLYVEWDFPLTVRAEPDILTPNIEYTPSPDQDGTISPQPTVFQITYGSPTNVEVIAPATANGYGWQYWDFGGGDHRLAQTQAFELNAPLVITAVYEEFPGGEIAMWVDSKQIPFAAVAYGGAIYLKRRSDSPATWNNAILIDNSSSAGYSNPGIVMTDDGRIIVTALDGDEATVDAAYVTFYSDDLGQTFVGPV